MLRDKFNSDDCSHALQIAGLALEDLLILSRETYSRFHGPTIELCAIVNGKSGACPNDCTFCAQSRYNKSVISEYPFRAPEDLLGEARRAEAAGAQRFSIVTSGASLSEKEFGMACEAIRLVKQETGLLPCASLGTITAKEGRRLKEAGLVRYHHNLETSRRFYPHICTTQLYDSRIATILAAREAGLEICVGGILGLGESVEDWTELIYEIKKIDPDSIPLNFFDPRPGTPLENMPLLTAQGAMKGIALFRVLLPHAILRLAGGRGKVLGELQTEAVKAGINGLMIGNYLTTRGSEIEADKRMISSLKLSTGIITKVGRVDV